MKKKSYISLKNLIRCFVVVFCFMGIYIFSMIELQDTEKDDVVEESRNDELESEEDDKNTTIVIPVEVEESVEIENVLYDALSLALGIDANKDETMALTKFEDATLQNNADAQYFAGVMYLHGIGTETDIAKAGQYLQKSYQNGNLSACYLYGQLAFMGAGVMQDYEAAVDAFLAIKDDNERVTEILSCMSRYGMGMEVNSNVEDLCLHNYGFYELNYEDATGKLKPLLEQYYEILKEREVYEPFDVELAFLLQTDPTMASLTTIYGKDNWLFYKNINDGDSYRDYVGDNAFDIEKLQSIANYLMEAKKQVESTGAEFILMIIPNKEIIYNEYMPTYIKRISDVTRTDKLVEYLEENTDLSILYLKDKYIEYKDDYPLFYKTDTHFNLVGSLVTVQELVKKISDKSPQLNLDDFDIHMTNYSGDIATMIGQQQKYAIDSVYFIGEDKIPEDDKLEESMLLIGDSFSEFINIEAAYYFKGIVQHVMIRDYDYSFASALEQNVDVGYDVVVFECVERYIQRLQGEE